MAKKKGAPPPKKLVQEECEEGLPPWLATFADLATNMLCFFVLLLSFANMDIQRFRDMVGSIKDAFGVQVAAPADKRPAGLPQVQANPNVPLDQDQRVMLAVVMHLKAKMEQENLEESVKISTDDVGIIMRVDNGLLFQPGTATLIQGAEKPLAQVIDILKEHNYHLVVRGHTDNQPTQNNLYPSNWELSSARAASALRYLIDQGGIKSSRLKAVGYADSQPLLPNTTAQNRSLNRRTEFFFHRPGERSW